MKAEVCVFNKIRAEIVLVPENQEEEKVLNLLMMITDTPPYRKGKARVRTLAGADSNLLVIDL
jgi:hypothetical protein